jgi:hypothetical protein
VEPAAAAALLPLEVRAVAALLPSVPQVAQP